jgi:NADH-quinone oxidoreductase subunit M
VIFGKVGEPPCSRNEDVNGREFLVLGVLAVSVVLLGVWPAPLLDMMRGSIEHLTQMILATKL